MFFRFLIFICFLFHRCKHWYLDHSADLINFLLNLTLGACAGYFCQIERALDIVILRNQLIPQFHEGKCLFLSAGCQKLFAVFQNLCLISSEKSVHLQPDNSIRGLTLHLKIKFCCLLYLAVHPEDISLIFQEISIFRKFLECFIDKSFCLNTVLSRILHQEAAPEFHKSQMSRISVQKILNNLLCFLHTVKFIMISRFSEKLDILFQFLHLRSDMI